MIKSRVFSNFDGRLHRFTNYRSRSDFRRVSASNFEDAAEPNVVGAVLFHAPLSRSKQSGKCLLFVLVAGIHDHSPTHGPFQFAIIEVVVTSIQDGFPKWIKSKLVYHELLVLIVVIVSFFFGIPNLIQAGIYYFQLIDHYVASITVVFLAFFQIIAIAWFYKVSRLSRNIKQMTGKMPSLYFRSCWLVIGPCLLFVSIPYLDASLGRKKVTY